MRLGDAMLSFCCHCVKLGGRIAVSMQMLPFGLHLLHVRTVLENPWKQVS
jgi:hypothetical protein